MAFHSNHHPCISPMSCIMLWVTIINNQQSTTTGRNQSSSLKIQYEMTMTAVSDFFFTTDNPQQPTNKKHRRVCFQRKGRNLSIDQNREEGERYPEHLKCPLLGFIFYVLIHKAISSNITCSSSSIIYSTMTLLQSCLCYLFVNYDGSRIFDQDFAWVYIF